MKRKALLIVVVVAFLAVSFGVVRGMPTENPDLTAVCVFCGIRQTTLGLPRPTVPVIYEIKTVVPRPTDTPTPVIYDIKTVVPRPTDAPPGSIAPRLP